MVGYAESLITTILRGSEDVFSEGGQMMYDPLTAERIHPSMLAHTYRILPIHPREK